MANTVVWGLAAFRMTHAVVPIAAPAAAKLHVASLDEFVFNKEIDRYDVESYGP